MTLSERSPEQYLQWVRWGMALVLLVPVARSAWGGAPVAEQGWLWLWMAVLAAQVFSYAPWPRSGHWRLTLHLLLDILLWNGVVWLTGGATNPFAALLLIPLALAFLMLPPGRAGLVLVVSVLCQLGQLAAVGDSAQQHGGMSGHFEAMVMGFIIASVLLALTLLYLRRQLQQRESDLQRLREGQLRDEQLLAVGTAAAQLTHEMATPMQSVRLLLDELEHSLDHSARRETEHTRVLMTRQLGRIEDLLADWRAIAEDVRERRLRPLALGELITSIRKLLVITRPGDSPQWEGDSDLAGARVRADRTLIPAILSLLHNALDAGGDVVVRSTTRNNRWRLDIENDGRSLSPELRERLGTEFVQSESGFGVGARLSYATLERFGGRVFWSGDECQTRTRLELPLEGKNG